NRDTATNGVLKEWELKGGEAIVISCVVSPDSSTTAAALWDRTWPMISPSAEHPITVSNVAAPNHKEDQLLLESFVHSAAENSHTSTSSGIDTAGTVMDHI